MADEENGSKMRKILSSSKTIAVVGISADSKRPSHYVADYLLGKGFKIIPVNPNLQSWEGIEAHPSLQSIPPNIHVDVVDVFRKAEFCLEIAQSAVEINAKALWLQEGIISKEAEKFASQNGLLVVMDRCMKKEYEKMTR